jgi:hypothetical protein
MKQERLLLIARRGFDEVWSGRNPSAADEIFAPDYIFHEAGRPEIKGLEPFKQLVAMYQTIFANLRFVVLDEIVGEDRIVTRWVKEGKVVETWTNWDMLGVLQQIGALPEMAS